MASYGVSPSLQQMPGNEPACDLAKKPIYFNEMISLLQTLFSISAKPLLAGLLLRGRAR